MAIVIQHLRKEYANLTPLKCVNAVIEKGEIVCVIGPSGTGKSTLLRCLNRLETPSGGRILVDGEDITDRRCNLPRLRRKMGMVFQSFNLFPHKTVLENVCMAAVDVLKKSRGEAEAEARALLKSVGLSDKADSHPAALSGGQQQRAAIARAMAMHPEILLFDEPTSALDPSMVSEVLDVMREIARTGTTMLIVTHEMRFARTISSRIFYMDEGVVYEDGSPDQIFDHPQREKTRAFILRIRSWNWRIPYPDHDDAALLDSLHVYLRRQYLDRRLGLAIELVLEEVLAALLKDTPPREPVNLELTLSAGEGASEAELTVAYPELKTDPLADAAKIDPLTWQILSAYAQLSHQPGTRQAGFRIHTREEGADNAKAN